MAGCEPVGNTFLYCSCVNRPSLIQDCLCSNVIYQFTCEDCSSFYVGSTIRSLHTRSHEHIGKSFLTGATLTSPPHSNVREHARKKKHSLSLENFRIIGRARSNDNIRLIESIFIRYLNPDLNDLESSMALHII